MTQGLGQSTIACRRLCLPDGSCGPGRGSPAITAHVPTARSLGRARRCHPRHHALHYNSSVPNHRVRTLTGVGARMAGPFVAPSSTRFVTRPMVPPQQPRCITPGALPSRPMYRPNMGGRGSAPSGAGSSVSSSAQAGHARARAPVQEAAAGEGFPRGDQWHVRIFILGFQ